MKRTCLNILAMVAVVLSLAACNDFLDIQPIGKVMPQTATEYRALLTEAYQWMEIFSIPLMLLYNGERGRGYQKLFYVFYPAHVYILYALSWLLMVSAPQLAA